LTISPVAFGDGDRTGGWYEEFLGRLPDLIDHPDRYRDLCPDEDETLRASATLVRSGQVRIEEDAELNLAVCWVPADAPDVGAHRFGGMWVDGLHPMAINNATDRFALLCVRDRRYEFTYRYESWVQYRSRRPHPRVDLRPLAAELTTAEAGHARWVFEGVETLSPRLYLADGDESHLAFATNNSVPTRPASRSCGSHTRRTFRS